MNVKKSGSRKTGYPSKRQFLAALGAGALTALSAQADAPRLDGVPPQPKQAAADKEVRLRGDIAVDPIKGGAATNVVPPATTNPPPPQILGKMRAVRPPGAPLRPSK